MRGVYIARCSIAESAVMVAIGLIFGILAILFIWQVYITGGLFGRSI